MRFANVIALTLASAMAVSADMIYHCTKPNTIALTFDDGPYEFTNELLDELKSAGIHATFFINGENWWGNVRQSSSKMAVIGRAVAEGHQVASHTWKHEIPKNRDQLKKSLADIEDLVQASSGKRPTYFRAPRGECDSSCISYIESLGYKLIQWDTDTNDWNYKYNNVEDRPRRVKEVKQFLTSEWNKNKSNYLVLMHDVQQHTVKSIVPWIAKNAPFDKYKFVTVAECLGDSTKGMVGEGAAPKTNQNTNSKANSNTTSNTTSNNTSNNTSNTTSNNTSNNASNTTTGSSREVSSNTGNREVPTTNTNNQYDTQNVDNTLQTAQTVTGYQDPTVPGTYPANTTDTGMLTNVIAGGNNGYNLNNGNNGNANNNNNDEIKSAAFNLTSNLYLVAALLVYSIYMVL